MDTLFNWELLQTLAGASALTYLIVSYTKRPIDKVWPKVLGTDLYAVAVGAGVLLIVSAALGMLAWQSAVLAVFNGFVIAAVAGKMHDKARGK